MRSPSTAILQLTNPNLFTPIFTLLRYIFMDTSSISSSVNTIIIIVIISIIGPHMIQFADCARAFFVFGDSLVDNGNNNYLLSIARADSYPYGIDFPTHRPTGRFSNGLILPDLISEGIGSKEPPMPYLSPQLNGQRLLVGANFASAGVGILNETGAQFLDILRMYRQLNYFQDYQRRLQALIGNQQTKRLITQSLVLITVGGNDFVNNYFSPSSISQSRLLPLPNYVNLLISEYQKILMNLYKLGARRFLVTGTGPMGCAPAELAQRSTNGGCSAELQQAADLYNPQLNQMLTRLNKKLGKNVFISVNTKQMHVDFITNPQAFGFTTSKVACCGQGPYNGQGLCTFLSNLCPNRNLYAFWDAFHPSEKANRIYAEKIMTGSTIYISPMNLSTIMALDSTI